MRSVVSKVLKRSVHLSHVSPEGLASAIWCLFTAMSSSGGIHCVSDLSNATS